MSKRKKSKAVPVVVVLTVLFAALCVGCFYAGQVLNARRAEILSKAQAEIKEQNEQARAEYAVALAEF